MAGRVSAIAIEEISSSRACDKSPDRVKRRQVRGLQGNEGAMFPKNRTASDLIIVFALLAGEGLGGQGLFFQKNCRQPGFSRMIVRKTP
jgi:hypothetical protein